MYHYLFDIQLPVSVITELQYYYIIVIVSHFIMSYHEILNLHARQ